MRGEGRETGNGGEVEEGEERSGGGGRGEMVRGEGVRGDCWGSGKERERGRDT